MAFKIFNKKPLTAGETTSAATAAAGASPAAEAEEPTSYNVNVDNPHEYREGEEGEFKYDDDDLSQCSAKSEWDEGGASHCGYSPFVHETLMTIGKSVHSVIGDPPEKAERVMKSVGGWFQEASYAVRDYTRGNSNIEEDTKDVVDTIISGGSTLGKTTSGVIPTTSQVIE